MTDASANFEELCKQYAPELMHSAYRGLLERQADPGGLLHHVDYLRGQGSVEGMLRRMAQSDEFLGLIQERSQRHLEAINNALPAASKKLAFFSNCQAINLSRCIQAMTGKRPPSFNFVTVEDMRKPAQRVASVRQAMEENDVVLMQPRFGGMMLKLMPELRDKLVLFPSISFPAFQPDQCYVRIKGTFSEVAGPLGPYHSSIVYYAWRSGMSQSQTASLFCTEVYEQLRFFDYWDSASDRLLLEGRRASMPLEGALKDWRARGCFMYSTNHPKLFVLADLARRIMLRLDMEPLAIDPLDVVWDSLADTAIWPVYPEIAQRLGVSGSYVFKANNPGTPGKAPVVTFDLEGFIAASFAAFTRYSQSHEIDCHRSYSARYQEVFGSERRYLSMSGQPHPPASTNSVTPVRASPYSGLPARQFWRSAIRETVAGDVDPVGEVGFSIDNATRIATAGSCFAQHIANRLRQRGFNYLNTEASAAGLGAAEAARRQFVTYSARYGNLYTARQLLQLFDRAYGHFQPDEAPWLRPDGRWADPFRPEIEPDGFASAAELLEDRERHLAATRRLFDQVEVFIFTLGLTEAWRSRVDGAVFPIAPGVVAGAMDSDRHEMVNFGVEDLTADLEAFVQRLAAVNPSARIVLTVSPVPLAATYESRHVLAANTYSKSVLRVVAEQMSRRHANCEYFPAYEIITGSFNRGAYFESDLRGVNAAGVDHVMRLFFGHYAPQAGAALLDAELLEEAEENFRVICEEERLDDESR